MKVGILTFHASHNYGSMLQAYALQKSVESLGHDCEIINFRTIRQRRCFRPFWRDYSKINMLKAFVRFPRLSYDAYVKYRLFEKFLREDLNLSSAEFQTYSDLESGAQGYDTYISGSDQIWNVSCYDWDKAYGLGFVHSGCRLAYAPSMGPKPEQEVLNNPNLEILANSIKKYDALSVREERTASIVNKLIGVNPEIVLDPTLLLSSDEWLRLEINTPLVKEDYIFLYSPWENIELYREALALSEKFGLKIITTLHHHYSKFRDNSNILFKIDVGPKEFLNLVRNARLVVGASFHAVAFAVIFKKQFYAFKGLDDQRILSLLQLIGLEQFADEPHGLIGALKLNKIYENADLKLQEAKLASIQFLKTSLSSKSSN